MNIQQHEHVVLPEIRSKAHVWKKRDTNWKFSKITHLLFDSSS